MPTQQERCLACAEAAGYYVDPKHDVYIEGGETGTNMDRPVLMDLLARCKDDKGVRAVVVYDVSRLARNRIDFALIKFPLRKAGIKLISATEPIDETPEGQMLEGVLSTVAEFFSAQSGRKVKANMRRKAETGGWPNLAPYGYANRKEKTSDDQIRAWIEPNTEESRWVKRAFELFATGQYTVKALASVLNREGFVVRRKRNRKTKVLHPSQLERMLRNKIYIGVIEWGGVVNERGMHESIIEPELFYRVQDLLLVRSGSTTRMRRYHSLFKRIAFCAECGSAMTIDLKETSSSWAIWYLRCRKAQKGKPVKCSQRYFTEEVYTAQVARLIQHVELPARAVDSLREKIQHLSGEENNVFEHARAELTEKREAVERRQENLLIRSLDENVHDEVQRSLYNRVRAELAEEHRRITRELSRLKVKLDRIGRMLLMALEIAEVAVHAFAADPDPEYRGLIARVIFKELRMKDGKIVDGRLSDPLALFRRWIGEKPLELLADLALLCAPDGSLVDGTRKGRKRQVSLPSIRNDLLRLQDTLTPEEEADIEACYLELRGRSLLPPSD